MNQFEPKQFGKYFLLRKLAVGGMAEIYIAKTYGVDGFEKQLAIKRILPHCAADKDFINMLIDEAKLSVLLSHANIVQVYDLGKVSDDYYISMEFIHGVNLRDILYRCRECNIELPVDIAVYIASEICKGLDYAHRKTDHNSQPLNIVHRDISPQNILLSYEGEVKIVDFGIAKAAMNISHTMAGILKGKIAYMSPEQAMGKPIDKRTDIFSSGILMYEMIANEKLFTGESQFEVLKKIRSTEVTETSLINKAPDPIQPILAKALAYQVDNRFQHAGDFQIELTKFLYSTYIDFTPRKLAHFIEDLFAKELNEENALQASEASMAELTSSVNVNGEKPQMDIVHRHTPAPNDNDTFQALNPTDPNLQHAQNHTVTKSAAQISGTDHTSTDTNKEKKPRIPLLLLTLFIMLIAFTGYLFFPQIKNTFLEFMNSDNPSIIVNNSHFSSIELKSTPSIAKIFLNDKDTQRQTPAILEELTIGKKYVIRLEKEGYRSIEKLITLTSSQTLPVEMKFDTPKGILNIITEPAGAAIMINNKITGLLTPAAIEDLPIKKQFSLALTKLGYIDYEQNITLNNNKPQKISLKLNALSPETGSIYFASTPKGAHIFIDGNDSGKQTPTTIDNIKVGNHIISLRLKGYNTWEKKYSVNTDKTIRVNHALKKIKKPIIQQLHNASIKITSSPASASIYLDGKKMNLRTPATIKQLKTSATYRITVKKNGFNNSSRKKTLSKKENTLHLTLKKKNTPPDNKPSDNKPGPGKIYISTSPSGADVFINSEYKGISPLTVALASGSNKVLINKKGYARYSKTVKVTRNKTTRLNNIRLNSLYGEVSLITTPPRASVIFDGQKIPAKTPVTIRKVRTDKSHTISISASGYRSWKKTFKMNDKTKKSFNIILEPK